MTDPISQIAALVAAWNEESGQNCNPIAHERNLLPIANDPARYPTNCLAVVVRYIRAQNRQASARNFMKQLDLYAIGKEFDKLDALINLALAWERNIPKKSLKAAFIDSLPATMQTHGIKQADAGNTTLARQAVADGLRQLSTEIAKGN